LELRCNEFCQSEGLFVQDFRYCFRNIRRQPACSGEINRVSSAAIVLANLISHGILCASLPPIKPRAKFVVEWKIIVNKDLHSGDPTSKKWMAAIRYLHMAKLSAPSSAKNLFPPLPIDSLQWTQAIL
jgi:hypothetical protein